MKLAKAKLGIMFFWTQEEKTKAAPRYKLNIHNILADANSPAWRPKEASSQTYWLW